MKSPEWRFWNLMKMKTATSFALCYKADESADESKK
jgi:hypothetical protein